MPDEEMHKQATAVLRGLMLKATAPPQGTPKWVMQAWTREIERMTADANWQRLRATLLCRQRDADRRARKQNERSTSRASISR